MIPRHQLAAVALRLLRDREAAYPARIEAGTMTQAVADESLATARAIVALWRWVLDPTCPAEPVWDDATGHFGVHAGFMLAQLRQAAEHYRRRADVAPGDALARELADCCEELVAWHACPGGCAAIQLQVVVESMRDGLPRPWEHPDAGPVLAAFGLSAEQPRKAA